MMSGRLLPAVAIVLVTLLYPLPSSQQLQPIPDAILQGLTQYGATALASEVTKLQKDYNNSVTAFLPVNKTCNGILQGKIDRCRACVSTSCQQRAKKVCQPAEWQLILAKGIQFFSKDIPKFLAGSVKGVFVDTLGNAIVNVGGQIGDFFSNSLPNAVVDVGKTVGNGAVDIGKEIGHVGESLGSGLIDIGKQIGHVGEDIGNGIVKLGNGAVDIGKDILHGISGAINNIGRIFGRRSVESEVSIVMRASSEPGCDAIQHDTSNACGYYINSCADCKLNPKTDCPGYTEAVERVMSSNNARAWLAKATEFTYHVISVKLDATSFDLATTGYKKVEVTVGILGKTLTFTMSQSVNPYNPVASGPSIVKQAIEVFKRS